MTWRRALAAAGLLGLGAVVGLASVALHHEWWTLLLAGAATLVTLFALPPGWWSRLAFALGWVILLGVVYQPRPEGDRVVVGDLHSYALLALATVVIVTAVGTLPRPR